LKPTLRPESDESPESEDDEELLLDEEEEDEEDEELLLLCFFLFTLLSPSGLSSHITKPSL